jgi:hypothetical protein
MESFIGVILLFAVLIINIVTANNENIVDLLPPEENIEYMKYLKRFVVLV